MTSNYQTFFNASSFAVVGNSEKMKFPELTYKGLKAMSKTVYPIDPLAIEIQGDKVYKGLNELPEKVGGIILELPKEETKDWISKAADIGIKDVWIHMGCETSEAKELAKERGVNLRTGTCAVMYVTPDFSFHSIHKWIMKLMGKY